MLKKILLVAIMLCCSGIVMAQEHPKAELFGGYSYQRFEGFNVHGWNASIMANIKSWFAIGGDFGGAYGSVEKVGVSIDTNLYSFMFGPQFSSRIHKVTAFTHVLVGGTRGSARVNQGSPLVGEFAVALMAGGGLDINLGKSLAVRVIQADYHSAWGDSGRGDGLRVSAGLVIKIN
jgi:hypothetical protein